MLTENLRFQQKDKYVLTHLLATPEAQNFWSGLGFSMSESGASGELRSMFRLDDPVIHPFKLGKSLLRYVAIDPGKMTNRERKRFAVAFSEFLRVN